MSELFTNLDEVIGIEEIHQKLKEKKKLNIYWGIAPTNNPHFAYFIPLLKIRDCIKENHNVTILLADVHSYMDGGSNAMTHISERTEYYKFILKEMLRVLNIQDNEYSIVKGSDYQFDMKYTIDLLKFSSMMNVNDAINAGSEVVKQTSEPKLSTLIYPLMQVLDEVSLEADIEIGGTDQRKIFMLSRDYVSKLGYEKCSYLITPVIPSLICEKKIHTNIKENGKIYFQDSNNLIKKKINKAYSVDKDNNIKTNGILAILKYILFPFYKKISLIRDIKYGGNISYEKYETFECDWVNGKIMSADIKAVVKDLINQMIEPVRKKINENSYLYHSAYPDKHNLTNMI